MRNRLIQMEWQLPTVFSSSSKLATGTALTALSCSTAVQRGASAVLKGQAVCWYTKFCPYSMHRSLVIDIFRCFWWGWGVQQVKFGCAGHGGINWVIKLCSRGLERRWQAEEETASLWDVIKPQNIRLTWLEPHQSFFWLISTLVK